SANKIAGDYYAERQSVVVDHATRIARNLSAVNLAGADVRAIRDLVAPDVTAQRVQMVEVYRVAPGGRTVDPVGDLAAPAMPPGYDRAAVGRLATQALTAPAPTSSVETMTGGAELLHAAVVVHSSGGAATGVVVATDYLTGDMAARSRRMTQAFENYNQ